MDDLLAITEMGIKENIMNAYINFQSANKGLQFSISKCKTLTIGKKTPLYQTKPLEVEKWEITYDQQGNITETYAGKTPLEEVSSVKYLGFIISSNGSNVENIASKKIKAINTTR